MLAPLRCVSEFFYEKCSCWDQASCPIRSVMQEVRGAVLEIMDRVTGRIFVSVGTGREPRRAGRRTVSFEKRRPRNRGTGARRAGSSRPPGVQPGEGRQAIACRRYPVGLCPVVCLNTRLKWVRDWKPTV